MQPAQFDRICRLFGLGERTEHPRPLSGGLIHNMYELNTTQGRYAVKCLNPQIMKRPEARGNFKEAEDIALFAGRHLAALPAKRLRGEAVQQIGDRYVLLFDWVDGSVLSRKDVTAAHCETIGSYLARVHQLDFETSLMPDDVRTVGHDWAADLKRGHAIGAEWCHALSGIVKALPVWEKQAMRARAALSTGLVTSHRDLDPKNVLWTQTGPVVIDWESAGPISRGLDVLETSLYWSEDETDRVNAEKFQAFLRGYTSQHNLTGVEWSAVFEASYSSKLDWLAYNLNRTFSTDRAERQVGTEQVSQTISDVTRHTERLETVKQWLRMMPRH
ncbi:phosphotransferase [Exiguobacterium sp. s193]|uniref:phosphotransferase n=1 Tax=Exiguobacterium sp. s193 TaxID=2751207 RepID=UPI001BEA535F|nr:phosphotransferase [Exiguobacterium sp. s193]